MANSKETLINQLTVYANSYFKWDGRAKYVLKIDERLGTYPIKKREAVLDKLIEDQDTIVSAHPDHENFSSYERNTTIEKIIRGKVKKVGNETIEKEFGSKLDKLDRFRDLADIISKRLESCDLKLQKYYDEKKILSKSKFTDSKSTEIHKIFKDFNDQMLIELKELATDFKDVEVYIETYVNDGYENIFDQIKNSLKGSIRDIITAMKDPIIDTTETAKGLQYINPDIVLIHKIKHNNWDVRVKLDERVHSYKKDLDQLILTKILGVDEIERIQELTIAIEKRDILLKKAGQTMTSSTAQKMMDVLPGDESKKGNKNDPRIVIAPDKRKELIEDFAKLVDHKVLSIEDAKYWLCADFQGFTKVDDTGRLLIPNTKNKDTLKYFIYQIYKDYKRGNKDIDLYRKMLIRRIDDFKDLTPKQIGNRFSFKPRDFPSGLEF